MVSIERSREKLYRMATHDVELVFALLVLDVFIHLLEAPGERAPAFSGRAVPDEDVTLIRDRGYYGLARMPLLGGVNQVG